MRSGSHLRRRISRLLTARARGTFAAPTSVGVRRVVLLLVVASMPILWAQQDFNGDLKADLLWRNASDGRYLVSVIDGTSVTNIPLTPPFGEAGWGVAGTGDFDGDLASDILWRHATDHRIAVTLMKGVPVTALALTPPVGEVGWRVAGTGDFDGDRKADVLWRNVIDGRNVVWLMRGATVAAQVPLNPMAEDNWSIAAVGDFNGDAGTDILWRNPIDGHAAIWLMNGVRVGASVQLSASLPADWVFLGTGDFNGDLRTDVLWRTDGGTRLTAWAMNGASATPVALAAPVSGARWQVADILDVDGDRRADILWMNATDGLVRVSATQGAEVASPLALASVVRSGWRIVSMAVDATGILEGATNYTGSYPAPGLVSFTTSDGRSLQVHAFPGQVQVFAQPAADQSAIVAGMRSRGATVLSTVPILGYYLVGVAGGTEASFIASVRAAAGVLDATPNLVVRTRQSAVPINEDYFLTERPVPLNVGPGVVVIDSGAHGDRVSNTVTAAGGTVGGRVNIAI